jgi:hypothetical protein
VDCITRCSLPRASLIVAHPSSYDNKRPTTIFPFPVSPQYTTPI